MNKEILANGPAVTSGASTAEAPAHSALPFYQFSVSASEIMICSHGHHIASVPVGGPIDEPEDHANAAFIVRACNNHGPLLAALEDMTSWFEGFEHDDLTSQEMLRKSRAAITAAKEQA